MLDDLLKQKQKKAMGLKISIEPEGEGLLDKEEEDKKVGLAPELKQEGDPETENIEDPQGLESMFDIKDLMALDDADKLKIQQMIEDKKNGKPTNSSLSDKVMMGAMKE